MSRWSHYRLTSTESPIQGLTLENIMCLGSSKLKIETVRGLVIENVRNEDSDKAVTMTDVTLRDTGVENENN